MGVATKEEENSSSGSERNLKISMAMRDLIEIPMASREFTLY